MGYSTTGSIGRGIVAAEAILLGLLLVGCSDQIVYRDRQVFDEPPAGAGDFLGYSSVATKKTSCGNCHAGKQAQWEQTGHAQAWSTLQASAGAATYCESCHTVSARGNLVAEANVGYVSTNNARYHDVQCESCHGPGLTHVLNPDAFGTKPLAPLAVGTDLTLGCGECHSGAHSPFVEEWSASRHGNVSASRGANASCAPCHEGRGALAAWGVQTVFLEQSQSNAYMGITCGVCHDPHNAANPGQLRFPDDVPSVENNLCMKCHYRRAVPEVASSSGPHSPQGPVLLGEAGWIPPNFEYPPKSLVGSHGSDRNPRLCATCHVNNYEISDPLTGAFQYRSTGHSFEAIPCVDGQGIPTGAASCDILQQSFRSCAECHSESTARGLLLLARNRLNGLANQISAMLPLIPSTEFSTSDNRISTAEGARFNMQLAQQPGSPVHNPFLCEALLLASIRQIGLDYGIVPPPGLEMRPLLTPPPALAGAGAQ